MSVPVSTDTDERGDAELISAVRDGDTHAYGVLFARHVGAARRLARQLAAPGDADDLVSEAFAKVFVVLQRGSGPDLAFRAYLLTAVRRLHVDRIRAGSKLHTTDDLTPYDPGVPFRDTAVEGFENTAAARAFGSLPERWQMVLWHTEVEELKPAEIAPLLGVSANSVSAIAYRAREGLRQAFLTMHAQDAEDEACEWTQDNLGAYVRNGCSRRDATRVEQHLGDCRRCTAIYLELTEVNSNLRGILAPLVLGGAASGYLASAGSAGALGGVGAILGRARDVVTGNAAASAVVAVATVVVAGAVAASIGIGGSGSPPAPGAGAPPAVSSTPPGTSDPGPPTPSEASPTTSQHTEPPAPVEVARVPPAVTAPGAPSEPPVDPSPTDPPSEPTRAITASIGPTPTVPTEPPPTAPPTTPPTEPPPVQLDLELDATHSGGPEAWHVQVLVQGPGGAPTGGLQGNVQAQATGDLAVVSLDPRCSIVSASALSCTLTEVTAVYDFDLEAPAGTQLTFTAAVGPGFEDPDTGSNATTITLTPPPTELIDLKVVAVANGGPLAWNVDVVVDVVGHDPTALEGQLTIGSDGPVTIIGGGGGCPVLQVFSASCQLDQVPWPYSFTVTPLSLLETTLTVTVDPGPGFEDPNPANNSTTVVLGP